MVVVDNGLFVSTAARLARDCGRVLYFCPNYSNYPTRHMSEIGKGVGDIERIKEFWPAVQEAEQDKDNFTFVFLDIHFGDWQVYLRSHGFHVWGSGDGEDLELYRWDTKQLQKAVGLPAGEAELIIGVDALEKHLETHKDVWIKVSEFRGIGETWHSENAKLAAARLDSLRDELGPLADIQEFIVEKSIKAKDEIGIDWFTVDGAYPEFVCPLGFEAKDLGYIGTTMPNEKLPPPVQKVNAALASVFKAYGYRGFYSSEIRDDVLIDSTARVPSPPGELYQEWWDNITEIIIEGARGRVVEIKPSAKYAFELILYSEFAANNWLAVEFPKTIERFVKLYNHCVIKGANWIVPTDAKLVQVGAVLGFGETIEAAIRQALGHAEQVKGDQLGVKKDSIPKLLEVLKESAANGNYFGESPIPEKI